MSGNRIRNLQEMAPRPTDVGALIAGGCIVPCRLGIYSVANHSTISVWDVLLPSRRQHDKIRIAFIAHVLA